MFCENCGAEFREEGTRCTTCGTPRPFDESTLDWEVAARLREEQEAAVVPVPPALRRIYAHTQDVDICVRPGAPQKICTNCGRSLPASTVSHLCALCAAHDNQDQSDRAFVVSRATPPLSAVPPVAPRLAYAGAYAADARKRPAAKWLLLIPVIWIVLSTVMGFFGILSNKKAEASVAPPVSAGVQEPAVVSPLEEEPEPAADEPFSLLNFTEEEVYANFILPASAQYLESVFPEMYADGVYVDIDSDLSLMEWDGDTAYLEGNLSYMESDEVYSDPFGIGIRFLDEETFDVPYLAFAGTVYWDE